MPVDRRRYPKNWPKVSRVIRRIAGNHCEFCGVGNGAIRINSKGRKYHVVLTVAHLDHDEHNLQRSNLRCLCQRCHLRHDQEHHSRNARRTRQRKRIEGLRRAGQQKLFEEVISTGTR